MKKFYLLDSNDPSQYDQWIRVWLALGSGEVFAHPEYVRLFMREDDRALCAVQESVTGMIMLPIILRPLSAEAWAGEDNIYLDVVVPYGFGGPFASGIYDMERFWHEFASWAEKCNIISSFFRFSPYAADVQGFVENVEVCGNLVIRSLTEGKEEIWKDFKHTVRTCVRRAEDSGLTVEFDENGERIRDFTSIYYQTMQRLNASERYYFPTDFFERIVKNLPGMYVFGHVMYQGNVIASKLVLISREHIFPFLGGAEKMFFGLNPNPVLDTEILYWGVDHGKKSCVLGGGKDGKDDGVFQYKKKFAPSGIFPFLIGKHIFNRNAYRSMCEKRKQYEGNRGIRWNSNGTYFPAYREKNK